MYRDVIHSQRLPTLTGEAPEVDACADLRAHPKYWSRTHCTQATLVRQESSPFLLLPPSRLEWATS